MKNIVIISGHPDLQHSVANATILDIISQELPEAEIRYLDRLYPTYQFDIAAEQKALLNADVIVWQFPLSWYSIPGLLKLWIDQVFLHGFSHGSKGKLSGKKLLLSFTTGAPLAAYSRQGAFHFSLDDFLPPFKTTATLCGLDFQPPIYTTGLSYTSRDSETQRKVQHNAAREHATRLIEAIRIITA